MFTPGRELGVEQQLPRRAELREVRQRAPADEQVAAEVVWALPCDAADSPSGWSSEAISVADVVPLVQLTVIARL